MEVDDIIGFYAFNTASLVQTVIFTNLLNFIIISVGLGLWILVGIAVGYFMEVKIDGDGTMRLKGSLVAVWTLDQWFFLKSMVKEC